VAFAERAERIFGAPRHEIIARTDGYLAVDLSLIRTLLVEQQTTTPPEGGAEYSDPAGIILLRSPGDFVHCGEPVARIRADASRAVGMVARVTIAFGVTETPLVSRAPEPV
jgi:hypothetical protein